MKWNLTIFTDESLTDIKRVVEADELKIPYRVSTYIIKALDNINLDSETDLFNFVTKNIDCVDKIIKATFGVTETELDCINTAELIVVAKELFAWTVGKIQGLKGNNEKN